MALHKLLPAEDIWRTKHTGTSYTQMAAAWRCSNSTIRYHVKRLDETIRREYKTLSIPDLAKKYQVGGDIIAAIVKRKKHG